MGSLCVKGEGLSRIQELKRNLSFALQESSWDDALSVLEKLVDLEGSQPAYHNQIGDIFLKSGRREAAMESFMRGIEAYRELGMLPNGAALCKKVLRLDPDQRDAVWYLGELKTRQGFLADGAEKVLESLRIFAEDPDYPKNQMLEKLATAESLQAGNREVLEFVATSYARMDESDLARCATLRIADLEEREGKRDKAGELRQLAQELNAESNAPPPAADRPPAAEEQAPALELAPSLPEPISAAQVDAPQVETLLVTAPELTPVEPVDRTPREEAPEETPEDGVAVSATEPDPAPVAEIEDASETDSAPFVTIEAAPVSMNEEFSDPEPGSLIEEEAPPEVVESIEVQPGMLFEAEPAAETHVEPEPEPEDERTPEPVVYEIPEPEGLELEPLEISASNIDEAAPIGTVAETEPETAEDDDETARLAASMLELLGETADGLPDVEVLGDGESEEDLLTTRQVIDTLSVDLQGSDEVRILRDEPERDFNEIPPPPEAPPVEEPVGEIADLMVTDSPFDGVEQDIEPVPEEPKAVVRDENEPISFDLSTTAEEALQTDDIHEVVGEFKRRMKEETGVMAPEERYQLGVSYMEMGLFEEALEEFELTLEHRVLGSKTREWMARCLLELNRPREIVLLLQTSLDAETYPHKSMVDLYYILGEAYEALKAWDLALDAFTKVYQLDPGFRNVQAKLAKLTTA